MAPGLHLPHVSGDTWADVNSLFSYYNEVYFGRKLGGTTQSDASSNKNAPCQRRAVGRAHAQALVCTRPDDCPLVTVCCAQGGA